MGAALVPIAAPTGPSLLLLRRLSPYGRTLLTFPQSPVKVHGSQCLFFPAWLGQLAGSGSGKAAASFWAP